MVIGIRRLLYTVLWLVVVLFAASLARAGQTLTETCAGRSAVVYTSAHLPAQNAVDDVACIQAAALEYGASHCPAARGKCLLALHGADDQNVSIAGGRGSKGLPHTVYASQAATAQVRTASGALYGPAGTVKGARSCDIPYGVRYF
jgi:hypothetical protein